MDTIDEGKDVLNARGWEGRGGVEEEGDGARGLRGVGRRFVLPDRNPLPGSNIVVTTTRDGNREDNILECGRRGDIVM